MLIKYDSLLLLSGVSDDHLPVIDQIHRRGLRYTLLHVLLGQSLIPAFDPNTAAIDQALTALTSVWSIVSLA